ncbi:MAG TPA: hypothetical protein VJB56_00665 [Candidatus Paceibacterota bacterium]
MVSGALVSIIGALFIWRGFTLESYFNIVIPAGVVVLLVGVVLILDDLHGIAVDWMHDHRAEYDASEEKQKSLRFRLAKFFAGPDGVVYLYPGGPIGATIAMLLTVVVSGFAAIVFCLVLARHLL